MRSKSCLRKKRLNGQHQNFTLTDLSNGAKLLGISRRSLSQFRILPSARARIEYSTVNTTSIEANLNKLADESQISGSSFGNRKRVGQQAPRGIKNYTGDFKAYGTDTVFAWR